ncbi:MAG: ribosome maturation factor RimM [Clostridium sp.]|nr:ribosome maturation factor RimM [Prevotella sp.]MCM1428794.1 ribosome maturation factor RimM [Clostridium sp.]
MNDIKELKSIGKFQRTHGLHGELNAIVNVDPDFFIEGYPMIVEVEGIFVPFYIDTVRPKGAKSDLLKIEGVDTEDAAKEFVNKEIYAQIFDLKDYFGDELESSPEDLVDYDVRNTNGVILGKIVHVDDSTVNVLLNVETKDGDTFFIPMAPQFIIEINDDARIVDVDVPDDLIHLNISDRD